MWRVQSRGPRPSGTRRDESAVAAQNSLRSEAWCAANLSRWTPLSCPCQNVQVPDSHDPEGPRPRVDRRLEGDRDGAADGDPDLVLRTRVLVPVVVLPQGVDDVPKDPSLRQ